MKSHWWEKQWWINAFAKEEIEQFVRLTFNNNDTEKVASSFGVEFVSKGNQKFVRVVDNNSYSHLHQGFNSAKDRWIYEGLLSTWEGVTSISPAKPPAPKGTRKKGSVVVEVDFKQKGKY